ncbi:hypothetical protein [Helicovermis profundi]|uniref:Uncharacterized protein n=1 Tax=Helicovermis profundi TaxID=3065157 RepID=A0AAU9E360_9FIRM|nr:hypothetical protein HLPR_11240 [Clostridia bacterium S502]
MIYIQKARVSQKCILCKNEISIGESYIQSIEHFKGGAAIVGVHADHITKNKKELKYINNVKMGKIHDICNTSAQLVSEGLSIFEAINEAKKIHEWSD